LVGITSIFPGLPFAWYSNACSLLNSFDMIYFLRSSS